MKHHFKSSDLTLGLELELQLINAHTQDLSTCAKEIIRQAQTSSFRENFKPEITQSMIEVNSSIHYKPSSLHKEMSLLCQYLKYISAKENISICGGGTHPFQNWAERKIFPALRFRRLAKEYGYLAKRYTVFSMHVHIGCNSPDKAIYLTHMLSRFVPQFITLSASSPFYNGLNTGFDSTRVNIGNAFPLSGHMPAVKDWSAFCAYYYKMCELAIINNMKDLYWDVRPKPDYGTVEVRVCDMPLTLSKATLLAAYIQTVASYILHETPYAFNYNLYDMYDYNRFQASRLGFDGTFINPFTLEKITIQKDILATIKMLRQHSKNIGTYPYLYELKKLTKRKENDAAFLKHQFSRKESLLKTVHYKCRAWKDSLMHA